METISSNMRISEGIDEQKLAEQKIKKIILDNNKLAQKAKAAREKNRKTSRTLLIWLAVFCSFFSTLLVILLMAHSQ